MSFCLGAIDASSSRIKPFNFEQFQKLLAKEQSITSVESLVASLPEEMRRIYALVYETRNKLQPASPLQPRVLLFNSDATLILAVSPLSNRVEVIHFDENEVTFRFATFNFDSAQLKSNERYKPDLAPQECRGCHGNRPNWDSYANWAGMFGSSSFNQAHGPEAVLFAEFLDQSAKTSIYQHLIGLQTKVVQRDGNGENSLEKVNSDITDLLARLNFRRISHMIRTHPRYLEFRAALIAAVDNAKNFLSFIPSSENLEAQWNGYEADVEERIDNYIDRVAERMDAAGATVNLRVKPVAEDLQPLAKIDFTLRQMGIDLNRESMIFEKNAPSFTSPVLFEAGPIRDFLHSELANDYPDLASVIPQRPPNARSAYLDIRRAGPLIEQLSLVRTRDQKACALRLKDRKKK